MDLTGSSCFNWDGLFSLQSVMKVVVSLSVFDAVDQDRILPDDSILVRKQDLSLYVQPVAELVRTSGYTTSADDLIRRAITESDSAAALKAPDEGYISLAVFCRRYVSCARGKSCADVPDCGGGDCGLSIGNGTNDA